MFLLRKTKNCFLMTILLFMLIRVSVNAEEPAKQEMSPADVTRLVVWGELGIAANAYLAAVDPHIYGGALVLLSPIAGPNRTDAASYAQLAAVESLGIYNLMIDPEKKSKREIFRENMIGWHVVAAVAFAVDPDSFLSDPRKKREKSVALVPSGDGLKLLYSQAF